MTWRVGLRVLLIVLGMAFLILGIFWWLPLTQDWGTSARGVLAPFLFATVSFILAGATFARGAKKSRSDEIMERARELHNPQRRRRGVFVACVVLTLVALIVAAVVAILVLS